MAEAATVGGTQRAAILLMTLGEQTAAAVLRHMEVEEVHKLGTAMAGLADVLRTFAQAQQADIALRVARLDEVPETALLELDAIVERQTKEAATVKTSRLGGVKAAAEMINLLGAGAQTTMIDTIKNEDAEL